MLQKNDLKNRSVISESMNVNFNLRFTTFNVKKSEKVTIIFTSSIKGEGKTLASVSTAMSLANDMHKDKKVILIGTDLRNPQVHKNFVEKSQIGLSELIYKNDHKNFKNYISRFDNLDVLFSGSIPPNPTAMLSSKTFKNLLELLRENYNYIINSDSAPCLLVSDTLQFISLADSVVYLFRSNFTDSKITNYINEIFVKKQIKNLNIVMNAVGRKCCLWL